MGISPHDTTDLATDLVYILTSCTSAPSRKRWDPVLARRPLLYSKCAFIQHERMRGVETGFVDKDGLCLVTRTGALN